MDQWKLLELNGPITSIATSPLTGYLLLTIESILIYWNLQTNQKIDLRCHTSPITSICFSPDSSYMVSSSLNTLVLWQSQSLEFIDSIYLPSPPPQKCFTKFINRQIIHCESYSSCYSFTVVIIQEFKLVHQRSVQLQTECGCLDFIVGNDSHLIITLEPLCVKFWDGDSWELLRKFNLNVVAKAIQYSEKLYFLVVLLENNTLCVFNRQGENLLVLSKPALKFTAIAVQKSMCLIGTCEGTILVLSLTKLKVTREVNLDNFSRIIELKLRNENSCVVNFLDGTLQVVKLSDSSVSLQLTGHSSAIRYLKWQSFSSFLSISKESLLYCWKNTGSGWAMQAVLLDQQLKLQKFDLSLNHHFIACGFTKGVVRVYKSETFVLLEEIIKEQSEVVMLKYSDIHNHLCIGFASGYFCVVNSQFDTLCEMKSSHLEPKSLFALKEVFKAPQALIYLALCSSESHLDIQIFTSSKNSLNRIHTKKFYLQEKCFALEFHVSGNYLLAACQSCSVFLLQVDSNEIAGVIKLGNTPKCLCVDPSGLYLCCGIDDSVMGKIEIYELGTGKKVSEIVGFDRFGAENVKFSLDGGQLLVGTKKGTLYVWKCPAGLSQHISVYLQKVKEGSGVWDLHRINIPKQTEQQVRLRTVNKRVNVKRERKIEVPRLNIPSESLSSSQDSQDLKYETNKFRMKAVRDSQDVNKKFPVRVGRENEGEEQPIALIKVRTNPVKYQTSDFYIKKPFINSKVCQPALKKTTYSIFSNTPTVDVESKPAPKRAISTNNYLSRMKLNKKCS